MTLQRFTILFPLWAVLATTLSLYKPEIFTWFSGNYLTFGLGIIMLGMGVTLTLDDFKRILELPSRVIAGAVLQYTIMPLSAFLMTIAFSLPPHYAAGIILVGASPGGTASNVITYLARANVALSVTMTSVSTLLSVILTPTIAAFLIGNRIEVNIAGLFLGTLQVVIIPIILGLILNRYFHRWTLKIQPLASPIAVIMIVLIVASIIGSSRDAIIGANFKLFLAIFLFHGFGFLLGYLFSWIFFKDKITARTISIEVGMQNSGLSVYLATTNFSNPLVAIPGAISSLVHSLIGSFLAGIWRKK